jgi:hypothetical protein
MDESELFQLLQIVGPLGHREMIGLLIYFYSRHHPMMCEDLRAPDYAMVINSVSIAPSCKYAIYFPYIWAKICPLLYVFSKRKLKDIPIKSIAKYLF